MKPEQLVSSVMAEARNRGQKWAAIVCNRETELERKLVPKVLIPMALIGMALAMSPAVLWGHMNNPWAPMALLVIAGVLLLNYAGDFQLEARLTRPKGKAKEIWDYCAKNRLNPKMVLMEMELRCDHGFTRYARPETVIQISW